MSKYNLNLGEVKNVEQTHSTINNNIKIIGGLERRPSIEIKGLELDDFEDALYKEMSHTPVCARIVDAVLHDDRIAQCSKLNGQLILPALLYRDLVADGLKVDPDLVTLKIAPIQLEVEVSCCKIVPIHPMDRFIHNVQAVYYKNENVQLTHHEIFSKIFTENAIDSMKVLVFDQ